MRKRPLNALMFSFWKQLVTLSYCRSKFEPICLWPFLRNDGEQPHVRFASGRLPIQKTKFSWSRIHNWRPLESNAVHFRGLGMVF